MSITSTKINKHVTPFQSVLDGVHNISNYYGYQPLKTGNRIPYFHHQFSQIIQQEQKEKIKFLINEQATSQELLKTDQPLVLAFRPFFNSNAKKQLYFLQALQADIEIMGGRLVVITNATKRAISIEENEQNNLQILSDAENNIAELFGLYNPKNPISDWLSGIEGEIALPAFFVVHPDSTIVFHYIDYNFRSYENAYLSEHQLIRRLLTSVYQHAQQILHPYSKVLEA